MLLNIQIVGVTQCSTCSGEMCWEMDFCMGRGALRNGLAVLYNSFRTIFRTIFTNYLDEKKNYDFYATHIVK